MSDGEEGFLLALALNEDDQITRGVYADWLDDHERYEDAARQRAWPEAKAWLVAFAEGHYDGYGEGGEFTYDKLVQALTEFAETGDSYVQHGSTSLQQATWGETEMLKEMWANWAIVTGKPVPTQYVDESPFSCSC